MSASGRSTATRPRRGRAGPRAADGLAGLDAVAIVALALWALVLVAASPHEMSLWSLNGLRSVPDTWPWLMLAALAALALGVWRPPSPWPWAAVGALLAFLVAFPLRERIHLLGDTLLRLNGLFAAGTPGMVSIANWWTRLHASPLDVLVNVLGPLALRPLGLTVVNSVSVISAGLALAYFALAWRVVGRYGVPPDLRGPLALAMVLTGLLEAFAGYADSAALVAVVALGWWGELLAPLERPAQAWRTTAWFVALLMSHRMAALMLLPMVARSLGPALAGDRPRARRWLLGLTALAVVAGILAAVASGAARQLGADVQELMRSARSFAPRPLDVLNTLVVVAPMALAAPALVGRAGAAFLRDPRMPWVVAAAAPLLVALVWVFPVGESGLGAYRDWDTSVLLGVALTVGAAAMLAVSGAERLRTALACSLPLLALTALGWVAVNADDAAAMRGAMALATSPTALSQPQRAHLYLYFGQRAMDERQPALAARHYDQAFALSGNPRRALFAAEAWLEAGDPGAARAALDRARAAGPLSPELDRAASTIEARLAVTDSTPSP